MKKEIEFNFQYIKRKLRLEGKSLKHFDLGHKIRAKEYISPLNFDAYTYPQNFKPFIAIYCDTCNSKEIIDTYDFAGENLTNQLKDEK